MKNLLTASILIFFLGTIIYSNTEAKVLPIIEGSELLDTLASHNNDEFNMPDQTAGINETVDLEHVISTLNNFPVKKLSYRDKSLFCYSLKFKSYNSPLYFKPGNNLRFIGQFHAQQIPGE